MSVRQNLMVVTLCIIDVELASQKSSRPEKKALARWLKTVPVDQDTINKVNSAKAQLCLFFFTPLRLFGVTHPPGINPHLCDPVFQLLSHEFTLDCLLRMATKDDLMYCGIRWAAFTHHPLKTQSLHCYFKFHLKFKQSDIAHECESTVAVAEAACCVESGQL